MRADKLPRLTEKTIVCIQAGNVNTGAFDPAEKSVLRQENKGLGCTWMAHSDLWARISRKYEHLTSGFEQADSWATDAHKCANVGYDSGVVMVRDGAALRASMGITAAYLEPGSRASPCTTLPKRPDARGSGAVGGAEVAGRSGLCALIERRAITRVDLPRGCAKAGLRC